MRPLNSASPRTLAMTHASQTGRYAIRGRETL